LTQVKPIDTAGALTDWAVSTGAFKRNKASPKRKVVAAALCNGGFSYREVSSMVGGISHVAARDAYLSLVTSLPPEERKFRREVAIDGSEVELDGRSYYIWLARDVDSGDFLSFQGSPTGSAEDGSRFLAAVAAQCSNKPVVRLGSEPNPPKGLLNLDLYFQSSPGSSLIDRISRIFLGGAS
jgi:transposase-like protein